MCHLRHRPLACATYVLYMHIPCTPFMYMHIPFTPFLYMQIPCCVVFSNVTHDVFHMRA